VLGCAPTEAAVLEARAAIPFGGYVRRCFEAARVAMVLVDTGYRGAENIGVEEMAALTGVRVATVLRLETCIEELIGQTRGLAQLEEALRVRIRGVRAEGIVGLKTIAAYRGGLVIEPRSKEDAGAALAELQQVHERNGTIRLVHRPLLDYLLHAALEEAAASELPVQVHTGFGDDDADLRLSNPLHLRPLLQDERLRSVPIILLHCYPYVREAGYLANLYANVYVDVSLSVPFTAAGSSARFFEALELAPATKVLFATDAFSIPELFYVGALHGRQALGRCLGQLVADAYLTIPEAEAAAHQILWQNACRIYGLSL
jgi:predicted TIM-barrel fold metal-dependent hydrolase